MSGIQLSDGTLTPSFDSATTTYTVSVDNSIESITVTPVTNDGDATFIISPSQPSSLDVGENTITIDVTAEDGTTTVTYTLTVNRVEASSTLYSRIITVNSGQVTGTLEDFPMVISVTDDSLKSVANGGHVSYSDGSDIYFTDVSGTTMYPSEIESYDCTTGTLVVWIKVSSLSEGAQIKMWYGGSSVDTNAEDVWSNGYEAVYHMTEADAEDSTANDNDGTASGDITDTEGVIGEAQDYVYGARITVANDDSLDFYSSLSYTWEAWVNQDGYYAGGEGIFEMGSTYYVYISGNGGFRFATGSRQGWKTQGSAAEGVPTTIGEWSHIVVTYSNGTVTFYVDGVPNWSGTNFAANDLLSSMLLGNTFGGNLDELEYSSVARSAEWVAAQYNNQYNPNGFCTIGDESSREIKALDHIIVTPSIAKVSIGNQTTYSAQGYDEDNVLLMGLTFTWGCTDATAGSIDSSSGVFTAGSTIGTYTGVITATSGTVSGTASVTVSSGIVYVDASGAGDYTSIQAAIDDSYDGDTIIVRDGTYAENITVDKALTIRSENTGGATVSPSVGTVFDVNSSNVTIEGFVITFTDTSSGYAITFAGDYTGCVFSNNTINDVGCGICIINGGQSTVSGNTITGSTAYGIYIMHGGHNAVFGNTITVSAAGIYLLNSSDNTISDNTVSDEYGTSSSYGIYVAYDSSQDSLGTESCSGNTVSGNTFNYTDYGIALDSVCNNTFFENNCFENIYGFQIKTSSCNSTGNTFYLNSISTISLINIDSSCSNNNWNSPSEVTYWYNGTQLTGYAGNYWGSYYEGTDENNDGIGDTAYTTVGTETDNYPLVFPVSCYLADSQSPSAAFISEVQSVQLQTPQSSYPLEFYNQSTGSAALTYLWDFGDGTTSGEQNPTHLYNSAGTYTVTLTVTNSYGSNTEEKTGYITVVSPIYVDATGAGDYTTIQAAIDAVASGSTVIVRDGAYEESLSVSKTLTIVSENGNSAVTIDGSVTFLASSVTLDGFTISGSVDSGQNINFFYGGHTIINNILTGGGITLLNSNNCTISNNSCKGIFLTRDRNTASVANNLISDNIFHDAVYGIYLYGFSPNYIENNTFINNVLINNDYGIRIRDARNNTFYKNSIIYSSIADIYPESSGGNTWSSPSQVTYWYNGIEYTGYVGNYWSGYTGTDADGDGIGDSDYTVIGTEVDSYPLMFPAYNYVQSEAPTADFTSDLQSGMVEFTVSFARTSTGSAPLTYEWNFGDGSTSSEQKTIQIYTTAGIYTVTLTVTDSLGSSTETKADYITVNSPEADFTADTPAGHSPLTVTFTDQSQGTGISGYLWDFGDGTTSEEQNPIHIYDTPGEYTVSLTVIFPSSTVNETKTNYIRVVDSGAFTFYVDASGNADYTTIQAAIDIASDGDTIIVMDGTYTENLTVDKSLTIQSQNGHDGVIINATSNNDVISISASNVLIDGLTIATLSDSSGIGIDLEDNSNNCIIKNNIIGGGKYGIEVRSCSSNTIYNNIIKEPSSGSSYGLYTRGATDNIFYGNTIIGYKYGIRFYSGGTENIFYANSFIGTTTSVYGNAYTGQIWCSTSQVTYLYTGVEYTGLVGNYWGSNYTGTDADGNGIGDTAYNSDSYPLIFATPTAGFTSTVTSNSSTITVQFANLSSGVGDLTYLWDFGDGTTSTDMSPTHTYDSVGAYTVTLSVTGESGYTSTATEQAFYLITVECGDNGTVSPSGTVPAGKTDTPVFTFTPDSGYHAVATVDGVEVAVTDNTYTFDGVSSDCTLAVSFVPDVTVSVDVPETTVYDSDIAVTLDVNEISNFEAADYIINYDPTVLRLDSITSGSIGGITVPVSYNESTAGTIKIVNDMSLPATGVSGSGTLLVLHFHVIGNAGTSSGITISSGTLASNTAEEIPASWESAAVTVTAVPVTITFSNMEYTYDGTPRYATVTLNPDVTYEITYYDSSDNVVTEPTDAGSYTVVVTVTQENYEGTATGTLVINPISVTVTLSNLSFIYDGNAKPATVTVNPEVTYSVTYNGSETAPVNAGSYEVVVTVTQANYSGTATGTLVIGKADQIITFAEIEDVGVASPDFTLTATASSGLTVTFTAEGPCEILADGVTVHITGVGECTITAHQDGNENYNAATVVVRTFEVIALDGDANGDGVVDATDLTKTIRIVLGLDSDTGTADANGDGVVNALDIAWIEQYILNNES